MYANFDVILCAATHRLPTKNTQICGENIHRNVILVKRVK